MAGDTPGRECPGEDHEMSPLAGTKKPSSGTVLDDDSRSPCVCVGGGLLLVDVTDAPTLSVEGLQLVPSRISVVRVDGTIAEDTPGQECPREDWDGRPRAGVTRPAGVSVGGGGAGSLWGGGTLPSLDVAGSLLPAVPTGGIPPRGAANPAGPDGPFVAGGSVGPCEMLSQMFHKNLNPLEHLVLVHAGPAGRHVAVGPVGPFRMLSSSDCDPAGPAGMYVAGGPVGPDDSFQVLEPLEHSVLDHADPAGQHAAVGPVGPLRTLSSSDCHPARLVRMLQGALLAQTNHSKFWNR